MLRLASMIYSLIAPTLTGSAVVGALVSGQDGLGPILLAAVLGAGAAVPVSYGVARALWSA